MTKQRHYPEKFDKLLYIKLGDAMQAVSDYCKENGEPSLAEFFNKNNGDGLRKYIDDTLDVSEPSFNGKTEARETKIRQARDSRQKAKSKK